MHSMLRTNSYGFQGCKKCSFDGVYGYTYSPEGLCQKCEFQQYPNRFTACLFCRRSNPVCNHKKSNNCIGCSNLIQNLLVTKLNTFQNKQLHKLEQAVFVCIYQSEELSKKYIPDFQDYKRYHDTFKEDSSPKIYKGAIKLPNGNSLHVWAKDFTIKPDDLKTPCDLAGSTFDTLKDYVWFICQKYRIFGPETADYVLKDLPSNNNNVFTYEEKK